MSDDAVPMDRLVKIYIKMRSAKKDLEQQALAIEAQMDTVKASILERCNEIGASSLRTPFGRIVRTLKTRYTTSDWEAMHTFMVENNALDLLQRRIHQTNMETFLKENPDRLPPGLNADREYDITVYSK